MSQAIDPFVHHPELREKIIVPHESEHRELDLTKLDGIMRSNGAATDWRYSDDFREASRRKLLESVAYDDLWVFAYGSLMMNPGFHFDEVRIAHLSGYERRFCLKSVLGRGTPKNPGLIAGLDNGKGCDGLAFRIPKKLVEEETRILWRREMLIHIYSPVFLTATTALGEIKTLAFIVDRTAKNYLSKLTFQHTVRYIATGVGEFGSSMEYLENMTNLLEVLGITDTPLFALRDAARSYATK